MNTPLAKSRRSIHHCIITLLLILVSSVSLAEQQITLEIVAQEEHMVITDDGKKKTQYIAIDSVIPGDVLLYTIRYHNQGKESAETVVITNPVPANMSYLDGSARGNDTVITFSADGGQYFDSPDKLVITAEDSKQRSAIASDYTHIQWRLNSALPADAQGTAGYRAKLK